MWPFSPTYPDTAPGDIADTEWDYIIVGGGTSGCVLANRLSENPQVKVLVIERGKAADTWISRIPLFSTHFASGKSSSLFYQSKPIAQLDGRATEIITGNALGGTSRINSMLYTRGLPAEYNAWSNSGLQGWSFEELLPYFIKSEKILDEKPSIFHGKKGEWQVQSHAEYFFPSTVSAIKAAESLGLPFYEDLNKPSQPSVGCSKVHYTIDKDGQRHSTFRAFLPQQLVSSRRGHLTICTGTLARKLDIKADTDGYLRAEGVYIQSLKPGSSTVYVRARREIIVSSGPLGSPCLLMLSGIGPESHLKELGINAVKHLPAVGSNLQDHMGLSTEYNIPMNESLLGLFKSPLMFLRELFKYLTKGQGLLLAPIVEVSIFGRTDLIGPDGVTVNSQETDSSNPAHLPDFEIMPDPIADPTPPEFDRSKGTFSQIVALLRPVSKGTVRLASSDPTDRPICDMNFLEAPEDWVNMRAAVKLAARLSQKMREDGYPIEDVHVPNIEDDADVDKFIRKYAKSLYHYTSTCRMGDEDGTNPGVVDAQLRVHGIRGLRVADSSVFPSVPATHTQAPSVVLAEKCADMVKNSARKWETYS